MLHLLLLCALALFATARVSSETDTPFNASHLLREPSKLSANQTERFPADIVWKAAGPDDDELGPELRWCKYVSRGTSLMKAMMMDEDQARTDLSWPYVQSPWDGDMKEDLKTWGYLDTDQLHEEHDEDCDFFYKHKLGQVFGDKDKLNIDPRSAGQGGPNRCFYIQHSESPAMMRNGAMPDLSDQKYVVADVEYRATDAHACMGVNSKDGFLYFLDRSSAYNSAKYLWQRLPVSSELPKLRSSSDIAFAFWNRATTAATRTNLRYMMACQIVNPHTEEVILRALSISNPEDIRAWPGTDFELAFGVAKGAEIDAALALLGSPNGIAAGYFLVQHKQQLGSKYIWKVKVFKSVEDYAYIMFYVSDSAPWKVPTSDIEAQLQKSHGKSGHKRSQNKASRESQKRKASKNRKA